MNELGIWTWVDYAHLKAEMPSLKIKSSGAISVRIRQIAEAGFIETMKGKGHRLYVRPLPKMDAAFTEVKASVHVDESRRSFKRTDHNTTDHSTRSPAETSSPGESSPEQPFDFAAYLESMRTNSQRHIQIIGRFFHAKGLTFDNLKQVQAAIKRHLRAARDLAGFTNQQIDFAIQKVERQHPDIEWTLDTLVKVLTK
jgi:hypothetical protein